jgi:hypothetical protein
VDVDSNKSTSAVVNPLKGHGAILRPDMAPSDMSDVFEMTRGSKVVFSNIKTFSILDSFAHGSLSPVAGAHSSWCNSMCEYPHVVVTSVT